MFSNTSHLGNMIRLNVGKLHWNEAHTVLATYMYACVLFQALTASPFTCTCKSTTLPFPLEVNPNYFMHITVAGIQMPAI